MTICRLLPTESLPGNPGLDWARTNDILGPGIFGN